ncbi:MAG: HAD-IC family P-type ATPase [bacterium]
MYYKKPIEDIFKEFSTTFHGISQLEAKERLKKYGLNIFKTAKARSVWQLILNQFSSPLIYILIIAALFTIIIRHYIDTWVILAIVIINSIVGFFQEYKAEKAMESLKKLTSLKAFVIRNSIEDRIDSIELVPGDIIILSAGNKVPADVRLFEVKDLQTDESTFTGESLSVIKQIEILANENLSIADQKNMAFMGTVITNGRGKGIIVKTGEQTELGKISKEVKSTVKEISPLQKKFINFSHKIGLITIGLAFIVLVLGIIEGINLNEIILFTISMMVAIIPEGLPIAATITMAIGLKKMADKNAIVKKLIAVETLGSCNFICLDKTGTITENQMTVVKSYTNGKEFDYTGIGYNPAGEILFNSKKINKDKDLKELLLTGLLCNKSDLYEENNEWRITGDPTEGALIVAAQKYGIDINKNEYLYRLIDEIPFNSYRQYMATMYQFDNSCIIFVKGSPEKILEFTGNINNTELHNQYLKMAESGLRVLGFGIKQIDNICPKNLDLEREATNELSFAGFQGIIDPPKKSAIQAVSATQKAGIKVIMFTGDHKITAIAIAKKIGIYNPDDLVITGQELDQHGDKFLEEFVEKISVYARVSPGHKLKIVEALQKKGNIVAVTGDGINDAPALKKANIGVAMGKVGTDVAKEASDMVLKDDNFESIFEAIKVGRVIYENIRKVVYFLLSSNVGTTLTIIMTLILGLPLPFLATQILWMNLVTNGLQDIALAYEPNEKNIEKKPPRNPKQNIISSYLLKRIILIGLVITIGTLGLFWYELQRGSSLTYARTTAMNTIVFFQFFQAWNSRSLEKSIFTINFFSNPFLFVSLAIALIAQILVLNYTPLQYIFHSTNLEPITWIQNIFVASTILIAVEIDKFIRNRIIFKNLNII